MQPLSFFLATLLIFVGAATTALTMTLGTAADDDLSPASSAAAL